MPEGQDKPGPLSSVDMRARLLTPQDMRSILDEWNARRDRITYGGEPEMGPPTVVSYPNTTTQPAIWNDYGTSSGTISTSVFPYIPVDTTAVSIEEIRSAAAQTQAEVARLKMEIQELIEVVKVLSHTIESFRQGMII